MPKRRIEFVLASALLVWGPMVLAAQPTPKSDEGPRPLDMPVEGVITNPQWLSKPTAQEVRRFYPAAALLINISGRVIIDCTVSAVGLLDSCKALQESPPGLGFGRAGLAITPLFRMRPRTGDGSAASDPEVQIPIRFVMPATSPPASSAPPRYPAPTPAAVALARRIAAASVGPSRSGGLDSAIALASGQMAQDPPATEAESKTRAVVLDSLRQAYLAAGAAQIDASANAYARTFSEAELRPMADFLESASGQAWIGRQAELAAASAQDVGRFWTTVRADAGARFCRQVACAPGAAPAPAR